MIRRLALACLLGIAPLHAQFPKPGLKEPSKPAEVSETAEQRTTRLEDSLDEAREQLRRLDDPGAESQVPEGISNEEFNSRRRDLQQWIASLERHLKTLETTPESIQDAARSRHARETWEGFKQSGPYSVLMVDDLRNKLDVAIEKKVTADSNLSLLQQALEEIRKLKEDSAAGVRRAAEALGDDSDLAAKWRLEAAKLHDRMLATRLEGTAAAITHQKNLQAAATDDASLLDLQIRAVRPHQTFSSNDLAKIKTQSATRQSALTKETQELDQGRRTALAERRKLTPTASADGGSPPVDDLTQARIDAAEARVDAFQFAIDMLDMLGQLESQLLHAYELRQTLLTSTDANTRQAAADALEEIEKSRLVPWATYADNQLKVIGAELREQESRASLLAIGDPRLVSIAETRASLGRKMAAVQRVAQNTALSTSLIRRWIGDYEAELEKQSLGERLSSFFQASGRRINIIWNTEVFHVDDDTGVTVKRLVGALLLFTVGYVLALRLSRRLQRAVVARGRIADAQAITLRRWLMVLVGFFLVVGTLHVMNIPLTVFAFFGGALAIGLGFGTQTLIKNFISGIIMLFERNIRVGDIVDVGGSVGTVTEINTRSSTLRSGEGMETLVPNSMFLENKITNWTHSNRRLRRTIRIGVEYGASTQKVAEVLVDCAQRHGKVLKSPEPVALFDDFGETALIFNLNFWVELSGSTSETQVASDLRFMIDKALNEVGIPPRRPGATTK